MRGRSSWYGTEERFVRPYATSRGGGISAFGILEWGSCGLTNGDGTMTVRRDEAAAIADGNVDYGLGACGRCIEVRCVDGPVIGRGNQPIQMSQGLFDFSSVANISDDHGRVFPGNPTQFQGFITVKCWSSESIYVKIVDVCPCWYCPKSGPDAFCRYQESCCRNLDHPKSGQEAWDLSWWAFERLAHPEYGVMMVDTRAVDCATHQPVPVAPSRIVYKDEPGVGWAWFSSGAPLASMNDFQVVKAGAGKNGSSAACSINDVNGGQTLWVRGLRSGASPFGSARSLLFSVLVRAPSSATKVPPLRIVISANNLSASMDPNEKPLILFCQHDIPLSQLESVKALQDQSGDWRSYILPLSLFNCPPSVIPALNKLDFLATEPLSFCLNDVSLA